MLLAIARGSGRRSEGKRMISGLDDESMDSDDDMLGRRTSPFRSGQESTVTRYGRSSDSDEVLWGTPAKPRSEFRQERSTDPKAESDEDLWGIPIRPPNQGVHVDTAVRAFDSEDEGWETSQRSLRDSLAWRMTSNSRWTELRSSPPEDYQVKETRGRESGRHRPKSRK